MRHPDSGMRGCFRGWVDRHPLFFAALVAAGALVLSRWSLPAAGLFLIGSGIAGLVLHRWRAAIAWVLCGCISLTVMSWRERSRDVAAASLPTLAPSAATGVVQKDARGSERFWSARTRLVEGPAAGCEVLWEGRGELPVAGSRVKGRGIFAPLPGPRNPGEFDRAEWLEKQGVAAAFQTGWAPTEVMTGRWAEIGSNLRQGFRSAVTAGLEEDSPEASVIRAVVIGEPPPDAEELIAAFRNSGTLHAFSVSGLHVAMVGSIGWLLLGWMGVPRRWAVAILIPLIFGYSWITGNSAPAVRSAWMAAVFLSAFVFRRNPDLLNALGAVLLVALLWDGRLLFQPGVQLSYGVVAAIAIGTRWATRSFQWMAAPELYLPGRRMTWWQKRWHQFRAGLASSLSVSLAAGIGSTPLTALHFGLVTPVSVIAGVVLVPVVYMLLAAGLLAAALFPVIPAAARGVNWANAKMAKFCVISAEAFAAIPGGHFQVGQEKRPQLLVFDLPFGAGAACFSAGNDGAVLIDCGDRRSFKRIVAPSLRNLGIEPDSVVLSHPDGNHLGGGSAVWRSFPIRQALVPVKLSRSPSFRSWMSDAPAAGVSLIPAETAATMTLPDAATLEILHAPDPLAKNALADERVAVFRLHWRGWKILLTSDAGMKTELKLLDAKKDISADVIIAGRNRSDISLCDRFLNAVDPQAIIASNPPAPVEEKLPEAAVAYWKSRGIQVIDQGTSGGVTLHIDEQGRLRIEGFLNADPILLTPR
jgi:competence protein ComEC